MPPTLETHKRTILIVAMYAKKDEQFVIEITFGSWEKFASCEPTADEAEKFSNFIQSHHLQQRSSHKNRDDA